MDLARPQAKGIVQEEPAHEGLANSGNELDGFSRLDDADETGKHAEHSRGAAVGDQPFRWRLGMQAAVTGATRRSEHGRLPFEAGDAAEDVRAPAEHAGVVHEIPRGKVVGAVDDDVRGGDKSLGRSKSRAAR